METLKAKLVEMGIKVDGLEEKQMKTLARALNVKLPHQVQVVEYTTKKTGKTSKYVKTSAYVLGTTPDGKNDMAQGLFVRADAIDQIIADLQAAKNMLG